MQQLDKPNEHEKRNEANTTQHKLVRETDDPRTSPDPALALEQLLAEAFATFDEPPATTHLVEQTHQTHLKLEDNDEDGLVLEDNDDGELQLEDNYDSDGLVLEENDEEDGLVLEANIADPSTRANLSRSTAQSDATANDTAVLHSFGGLELAAVAASVTAPAASSTDVPVELKFARLNVRTALMLYRNEHQTHTQGAPTSNVSFDELTGSLNGSGIQLASCVTALDNIHDRSIPPTTSRDMPPDISKFHAQVNESASAQRNPKLVHDAQRVSTSTAFGAAIIESRATNDASPSLSTTATANGAATIPSAAVTAAASATALTTSVTSLIAAGPDRGNIQSDLAAHSLPASAMATECGPPTTGLGGIDVCSNQPYSPHLETAPHASPDTSLSVDQPITTGMHHLEPSLDTPIRKHHLEPSIDTATGMHHLEPSLNLDIDSLQSPYLRAMAQAARAAGVHVSACTYDPAMPHPASAVWYLPVTNGMHHPSTASAAGVPPPMYEANSIH